MHIKILTKEEFEDFVNKNPLGNYHQTIHYANLMKNNGFLYDLIGYVDEYNNIYAASLILKKNVTKWFKYGYAPKGFIIDYFNKELINNFTKAIIRFYKKQFLVFIKINPEIAIAEIDTKTRKKTYTSNIEIKDILIENNYIKLKDNLYFESKIPKYNGIINLSKFSLNNLEKNTRNKIKRSLNKGLEFEIGKEKDIEFLYNFIKKKKNKSLNYYQEYYKNFKEQADILLISLNTKKFLENAKNTYEKELNLNTELAHLLTEQQTEKQLNIKMNSDKKLLSYKNDCLDANNLIKIGDKIYIGGALIIKYKNRVNIAISGFDTKYKRFNPNYALHYNICKHYKNKYDFLDLNGLTGDFTSENPYKGLNDFKLGFKPKIYEFIGEYDLVLSKNLYRYMLKSGKLAKIFNKPSKK